MRTSQFAFLFFHVTAAVSLQRPSHDATPLPSKDQFYSPPSTWQHAIPGDILRILEAPGHLTASFVNTSKAYHILYRSTDTNYLPTYGFTTLLTPSYPAQGDANQVLSYLIPYDTPNVDAGPTTMLYGNATTLGQIYTDIQASLSRGWCVNVPDYEGPKASFICEVQAAHSVLDSVRAVLKSPLSSSKTSSRVALWGYSGGSIAGEMALEMQIQYAPELRSTLVGAALGGIAPNITDVLYNIAPPSYNNNWLTASIMVGFSTQHPEVEKYLLSQLKPEGSMYSASNFLAAKNMTQSEAMAFYGNQTMANYFKSGLDFFQAPVLQAVFARDASGGVHGLPQVPMIVYKAIHDEVPSVASADKLVERFCEYEATNILYERNTIGGHQAESLNGDARALTWLGSVLSGTYGHEGCTIRNVTVGTETGEML